MVVLVLSMAAVVPVARAQSIEVRFGVGGPERLHGALELAASSAASDVGTAVPDPILDGALDTDAASSVALGREDRIVLSLRAQETDGRIAVEARAIRGVAVYRYALAEESTLALIARNAAHEALTELVARLSASTSAQLPAVEATPSEEPDTVEVDADIAAAVEGPHIEHYQEPALLIAGCLTFALSWGLAIGGSILASDLEVYNVADWSWVPIAGGFIAPQYLGDNTRAAYPIEALGAVISLLQIAGIGMIIGGAIWFAIGGDRTVQPVQPPRERRRRRRRHVSVNVSPFGVLVQW